MKTSEEWNKSLDPRMGIEEREQDIERIQQIQIDTLRFAASICGCYDCNNTILTAASNLKELPPT